MVWSLSGAQRCGSVECSSVQCDGGGQWTANSPLWSQHPQLTAGPDPRTRFLPQQGLRAHILLPSLGPDVLLFVQMSCLVLQMFYLVTGQSSLGVTCHGS